MERQTPVPPGQTESHTQKPLWEQVLYNPKNKNKKTRTTRPSTQQVQDRTALLLSSPLTHHTTQRILHAVESPKYQGANNPHKYCLMERLLAPFYRSQQYRLPRKAEALSVYMGNSLLCAQHTLTHTAARLTTCFTTTTQIYLQTAAMMSSTSHGAVTSFIKKCKQDQPPLPGSHETCFLGYPSPETAWSQTDDAYPSPTHPRTTQAQTTEERLAHRQANGQRV